MTFRSGPGATRTRDLLLRRQALYPTELRTRRSGGENSPECPVYATSRWLAAGPLGPPAQRYPSPAAWRLAWRLRDANEPPGQAARRTIGAPGFEPGTSCSRSRRANRAALRPVVCETGEC